MPPPPYSSKGFRHFRLGFTLAEMLIILAIIGIIAALTVPTLMNKYENHKNVVTLKKAYAELSHNYKMFLLENPGIEKENGTTLKNEFTDYLIQKAGYKDYYLGKSGNKWIYMKNLDNKFNWGYSFKSVEEAKTTPASVILIPPNGAYYLGIYQTTLASLIVFTDTQKAKISLDIGWYSTREDNKPGPTWGRNIFTFMPSNGNILPSAGIAGNGASNNWGTWKEHQTCNPGLNNVYSNGSGCAQRILQDGWQMKY